MLSEEKTVSCRKKILVADDDSEIRNLLILSLSSKGYDVISCADGAAALVKIKEHRPELLILDLMMPVMDGYHLCHHVVFESDIYPVPKIIMLTCRKENRDREMGERTGADIYMTKPFSIDSVADKVKELIGGPQK